MEQMKQKFFTAPLVCLLAALWAAPAWAYPDWISCKPTVRLVRNEKQTDPNSGTYKRFCLTVTYTNRSKDKIVEAIFNKTIDLTCDLYRKEGRNEIKAADYKTEPTHKSTKVNKCELWPGQSMELNYYLQLDISSWRSAEQRKKFNTSEIVAKNIRWSHDFQVQSKKISGLEPDAPGQTVSVTVGNKTGVPVIVALAKISTLGNNASDLSKGWWKVDPGKTVTIPFGDYRSEFKYFYYAEANGGKRWWGGGDDGRIFHVPSQNSFEGHPDKQISGGKKVRFGHLKVSGEGKASLNFEDPVRTVSVAVTNGTDAPLYVAFGKISTGKDNASDLSRGWWKVDPSKTRTIAFGNYRSDFKYFYYAESNGGKRVWAGGDDGHIFQVHPKDAFELHPDKRISDGKQVRFRPLKVSSEGKAILGLVK